MTNNREMTIDEVRRAIVRVELSSTEIWDVPLMAIAVDRAENYKHEFGGDVTRSLDEDTLPLFAEDMYEADDWRRNNMDFAMVKDQATRVASPDTDEDLEEGWCNGGAEVLLFDIDGEEEELWSSL